MTTSLWAILISLVSLTVSLISLGWNIWSKFIYPKSQVHVEVGWLGTGIPKSENDRKPKNVNLDPYCAVTMKVTNHGPGRVILASVIQTLVHRSKDDKKVSHTSHLNLMGKDHGGHFTGLTEKDLPIALEVGEQAKFFFSTSLLWSLKADAKSTFLGVIDTWGRPHLARRRDVARALGIVQRVYNSHTRN